MTPVDLSLTKVLIAGAKKHGWRLQWQQENPKLGSGKSAARYETYCTATTHAEALALGAKASDLRWDLRYGYLQIFPESLRTAPHQQRALQTEVTIARRRQQQR